MFDDNKGMYATDETVIWKILNRFDEKLYLLSCDKNGEVKQSKKDMGTTFVSATHLVIMWEHLMIKYWVTKIFLKIKHHRSTLIRHKIIIFSHELKNSVELNGNGIKKHYSGGDQLVRRVHCGLEINYILHYLTFCFANDLHKIAPFDSAVNDRINIISNILKDMLMSHLMILNWKKMNILILKLQLMNLK